MKSIINRVLLVSVSVSALAISPCALAQDSTASTGVVFRLGQALNRAFLVKPRAQAKEVDVSTRVHYAATVYADEGKATANHDLTSSHGLFIHWKLDDPNRRARPGHALAE